MQNPLTDPIGTAFAMRLPIAKALPHADDGTIRHCGIASDLAEDLQGQNIDQELLSKSFGYLSQHGKHTYDHGKEDIGDVLGIRHMEPAEAKDLFDLEIVSKGTAVWGTVYPLVDPMLASEDLKKAHHRMRAGARLAYSLEGGAVRNAQGKLVRMFIPIVTICPQPINASSRCMVVKSLTAALEHIGLGKDEDLEEFRKGLSMVPREPEVVIAYEGPSMGQEGLQTDTVSVSQVMFGQLVRLALGLNRDFPPLGQLAPAVERRIRETEQPAMQKLAAVLQAAARRR